jgi:hypothetical protein
VGVGLTYQVEPKQGWLLITFKGLYDSSLAEEFTDQVWEVCVSHKPAKLLIDMRGVDGDMSKWDRYGLAVIAAKKYFLAILRGKVKSCTFAIVGNIPLVDPDKFEEVVATNRGLDLKVFTDIKKAYLWLGVDPA